jgi:hypothetical protein
MSFAVGMGAGMASGFISGYAAGQSRARERVRAHLGMLVETGEIRVTGEDGLPVSLDGVLDDALRSPATKRRRGLLLTLLLIGSCILGLLAFFLLRG